MKGKRDCAENPWTAMAEAEAVPRAGGRVFTVLRSARACVFLGSGLILFLELVLIRELGAKVVHLSYFTNFVLLGSFLGVGLGFLASGRRLSVARLSPLFLVGLLALVTLLPVQIDRRSDQVHLLHRGRAVGATDVGDVADHLRQRRRVRDGTGAAHRS